MIEEEGTDQDQDHTTEGMEATGIGEIEGADPAEEGLDRMRDTGEEMMIGTEEGLVTEEEVVMVAAGLKRQDSEGEVIRETMKTGGALTTSQEIETLTIEIEMTQEIRESTETDHEGKSLRG
jgi:hypothetical protein